MSGCVAFAPFFFGGDFVLSSRTARAASHVTGALRPGAVHTGVLAVDRRHVAVLPIPASDDLLGRFGLASPRPAPISRLRFPPPLDARTSPRLVAARTHRRPRPRTSPPRASRRRVLLSPRLPKRGRRLFGKQVRERKGFPKNRRPLLGSPRALEQVRCELGELRPFAFRQRDVRRERFLFHAFDDVR